MIEISDIRYLEAIARLGSLSKAAAQLEVSQPTLSKRIARLERSLNIDLFHRGIEGMVPTAAAYYVLAEGGKILGAMQRVTRHLERLSRLEEGTLNLGVGPIIEQVALKRLMVAFITAHPNVTLSVKVGNPRQLEAWVEDGTVDLAIGPMSEAMKEGCCFSAVMSRGIVAAVRAGHPLTAHAQGVSLKQLLAYPSAMPHLSAEMLSGVEALIGAVPAQFPTIACDNYAACKAIVAATEYFSAGPDIVFREEVESGALQLLPVHDLFSWTAFWFCKPEALHIPALKRVTEILGGACAK